MTNVRDIDLDLHQDDIELLGELMRKYHPEGVAIPEGFPISVELENPMIGFQFPRALVEWARAMNDTYDDKEFVVALIKRILEELGIIRFDPGDKGTPIYKSIN